MNKLCRILYLPAGLMTGFGLKSLIKDNPSPNLPKIAAASILVVGLVLTALAIYGWVIEYRKLKVFQNTLVN